VGKREKTKTELCCSLGLYEKNAFWSAGFFRTRVPFNLQQLKFQVGNALILEGKGERFMRILSSYIVNQYKLEWFRLRLE